MKARVVDPFREKKVEVTLKYIDPSSLGVPASRTDGVYCWDVARSGAHAATAGHTELLIGRWHGRFVHVPMPLATASASWWTSRDRWMSVAESTGQPISRERGMRASRG